MRLQTVYKGMVTLTAALIMGGTAHAQMAQFHGDQYVIIGGAQALINKSMSNQTDKMTKVAIEEGVQGAEFLVIKGWESKYNAYLKTTQGYASALKAATTLYAEGVILLRNLYTITKAVQHNPQGIVSTAAMNNLYIEAASEVLKTYDVLKYSIALGTQKNMLNGAQRTELLYLVGDQLYKLNKTLRSLSISLAFYDLRDVWNQAISGLGVTDKRYWAEYALDKWKRRSREIRTFTGWRTRLTFY